MVAGPRTSLRVGLLVLSAAGGAFSLPGPRREPRGVDAVARSSVMFCEAHNRKVSFRNQSYLCQGPKPHYLCLSCAADIGGSARNVCPDPHCGFVPRL